MINDASIIFLFLTLLAYVQVQRLRKPSAVLPLDKSVALTTQFLKVQ